MRTFMLWVALSMVAACSPAAGGDFEGGREAESENADQGPVAWTPPGSSEEPEPDVPSGPSTEPAPEPTPSDIPPDDPPPDVPPEDPPDDPPDGPTCTYPSGPYGAGPGSTIDPSLSWSGFVPGTAASTDFSSEAFFDCDGSRGINAVLIIYAAGWCSACKDEAMHLPQQMSTWGPSGVVVAELIIETSSGFPADLSTAQQWRDGFGLDAVYVGADPGFALDSPYASALPFKLLINPRTMSIVRVYSGDEYDHEILPLAQSNM